MFRVILTHVFRQTRNPFISKINKKSIKDPTKQHEKHRIAKCREGEEAVAAYNRTRGTRTSDSDNDSDSEDSESDDENNRHLVKKREDSLRIEYNFRLSIPEKQQQTTVMPNHTHLPSYGKNYLGLFQELNGSPGCYCESAIAKPTSHSSHPPK